MCRTRSSTASGPIQLVDEVARPRFFLYKIARHTRKCQIRSEADVCGHGCSTNYASQVCGYCTEIRGRDLCRSTEHGLCPIGARGLAALFGAVAAMSRALVECGSNSTSKKKSAGIRIIHSPCRLPDYCCNPISHRRWGSQSIAKKKKAKSYSGGHTTTRSPRRALPGCLGGWVGRA